jgi:hypothetical protein
MPIWLHLTLTILCTAVCFFAGAIIGACASTFVMQTLDGLGIDGNVVNLLVIPPLFFGGAILGLILGRTFAVHYLPARCPNCGSRTFYRPGRPITYHCGSCRYVHRTSVRGG